ncbi:ABC transporter permease [Streptomyces iranensis]|uniref:ABC-type transporter, integral membrane subunit n=1 Tax=Streptomyces iranensis TaxID=576784 RepID=A0A060ZB43_9ACTN|nr:ABC transporter permease [Streptomyces iranensis]MBP2068566.1 peptide/nickel transport system permease protein [Streptomyces iranensis]CDR01293.1 ABC-type transporter, integral membrane subunit [Streptomyces iranensis]
MLGYTIRRIGAALFVLWAISVLVFLIFFATPGVDPAARIAGRNADPATLEQVRRSFGFDAPITTQYLKMMNHLFLERDLTSFVNRGSRVVPQITDALPATLSLVIGAAVIWMAVGIAMGTAAAAWRGKAADPVITLLGILGVSMPVYWLGEVINLFTQSRMHETVFRWVPPLGYVAPTENPWQWFLHLIFPWLSLAVLYAGIYARLLRGELIGALREDYVRTARAKGISERRILVRHALRCSLIPVVSLFGLDFGALVGGAGLLTEVVFGIPGIGHLTYNALQNLDLPVIMGTVMYAAFFVVLANAAVDLFYARLDPRVRHV